MERKVAHRPSSPASDWCAQVVLSVICLVVTLTCPGVVAQSIDDSEGSPTSKHDSHHDQTITWSVIITVVTVLLIVITVVVIYTVRRARYGAFCCIQAPRIRYRLETHESDADSGEDATDSHPPAYEPSSLPPPDYSDALHDVVLQQGRRRPQSILARSLVYTTTLSSPPPYNDDQGEESSMFDGSNRLSDEEGHGSQYFGASELTYNPDLSSDPPSFTVSVPETYQQSQGVQHVHEGSGHEAVQKEHLQVGVRLEEADGEEEGKDDSTGYCSCEDSTPLVE